MKLKHIYTIIVALLLFTGCAENEICEDVNGTSHELVPLRFNISAMAEVETRGIALPEEERMEGEYVGIFLLTEDEYEDLLNDRIKYVDNEAQIDGKPELYDYYRHFNKREGEELQHNVKFRVEKNGSLKAVNGETLFYSTTGRTVVFAYAPYNEYMTKETLFQGKMVIPEVQTDEDYDFCLGTPVGTPGNPLEFSNSPISLSFRHQLSRIVLNIPFEDLKAMCPNLDDVQSIEVSVGNVPVSRAFALAKSGIDYSYEGEAVSDVVVKMASYESSALTDKGISPYAFVIPYTGVIPKFYLTFKSDVSETNIGLSLTDKTKPVDLEIGASTLFNCTYTPNDLDKDVSVGIGEGVADNTLEALSRKR